jgi:hypothetical protein
MDDCDKGAEYSSALIGHALLDVLAGAGESIGFASRSESLVQEAHNVCLVAAEWDTRSLQLFGKHLPTTSRFDAVGCYETSIEGHDPKARESLKPESVTHPQHKPKNGNLRLLN